MGTELAAATRIVRSAAVKAIVGTGTRVVRA